MQTSQQQTHNSLCSRAHARPQARSRTRNTATSRVSH